jgi:hypothetical protein
VEFRIPAYGYANELVKDRYLFRVFNIVSEAPVHMYFNDDSC